MNSSIWQDFLMWLRETIPDEEQEVEAVLSMVSMFALQMKQIPKPIKEISSIIEIEHLQSITQKQGALGLCSKKMLSKTYHALDIYVKFLKKEYVVLKESVVSMNCRVDLSKSISYIHTKPVSCKYKGLDIPCIGGWNAVFINLTRLIYQDYGDIFPVCCSLSSGYHTDIGSADGMNYPKKIADGIYLECNVSATGIVNKLRTLFDICGVDYADVIIEYRRTGDDRVLAGEDGKTSVQQTGKQNLPYTEILTKLLFDRYKYGFRLGSPIELMRIRNYAEENGVYLPSSDEELEQEIASAGMNVGGKVFVISKDILSQVASLLDTAFSDGVTVIFLDRLMKVNQEWLSEQRIITTDMLQTILKRVRPQYYYGRNIITPGEKLSEYDAIVKEILRVCNGQSVIYTDELRRQLPYIPSKKVIWSLSMSLEFVRITEGKYFIMNRFVISEEDAAIISVYAARECKLNGYASIANLPLGNIPEDNFEFSETAIQKAVYNTVLKEKYYLRGKILTEKDDSVDIYTILKTYCNGKSRCTVSELMNRSAELTGVQNKQIVLTVLYDSMVRVGLDEFISEVHLDFDIYVIDDLLRNSVGTRFAPIRIVNTFALFPSCGVSWNYYVLESFCYRFSKAYRLSVINYNDKNAGLIVSKDLALSYEDILCETAANSNVELTDEAIGQYLFDNGYTAKRKYVKMPKILERAKKIREKG